MGNPPALFVVEGCEKGVVDCLSDLDDWTADVLAEACLVAELLCESRTRDEHDRVPEHIDLEYFSVCLGEFLQ